MFALFVALAAVAPAAARADEPTFSLGGAAGEPSFKYGSKEEAEELAKVDQVEWKASSQAGLVLTTGNSRVTTFIAGASASRKANGNKFALEGGLAYARSSIFLAADTNNDGFIEPDEIARPSQTTTRSWMLKGRYDRFLTSHNSIYGAAGLMADQPAGKELVGNGQVGYSREVYKDKVHLVLAEGGYDYSYENLVAQTAGLSIHSIRGFVGYTGKLSDDSSVEASAEGLFNLNSYDTVSGHVSAFGDNRFTGKLSITTQLLNKIAFRFSFESHYDSSPAPRPPFAVPYAPGFTPLAESLDTKTEASLIYNFL